MGVGKLIDVTGEQGTRYLGVLRQARVGDAADSCQWRIGGGRTRVFQDVIEQIQGQPLPAGERGADIVLLKHAQREYKSYFSTSRTWEQIRGRREKVI